MEHAPVAELLYHPDPAVRRQGAELALAADEAPLAVDDAGVVSAPKGVHGAALRLLLAAPAALRERVRTLYLALDAESLALLPRLVELPDLRALHLLGDGPLDLSPLEALPRLACVVHGGAMDHAPVRGLERLGRLEHLALYSGLRQGLPDLRALTRLREVRLGGSDDLGGLDLLPPQIGALHLASRPDGGWERRLARFPLEELTLPFLPPDLPASSFPSLRRLNTIQRDGHHLLRWPLRRLSLFNASESALRALADHPTLRHLALEHALGEPPSAFSDSAVAALSRLEVFDPAGLLWERRASLPWPPAARCPPSWFQVPSGRAEGLPLPPEVRRRSMAGWWAEGRTLAVSAEHSAYAHLGIVSRALSAMWERTSMGAHEVARAALASAVPFLTAHEARVLQGVLLAYGLPAAIRPMTEAERGAPAAE